MMFLRLVSGVPLRLLYFFSDFLFVITFYVLRYRRAMVWKNLTASFPEKTTGELRGIEKEFYRNLCDYSIETLKLLSLSQQQLQERVKFVNADILAPNVAQSESVLMLASHQFNWEWLLAAGCFSLPMEVDFVYQPQRSDLFNRFSLAIRTRFGGHPIEREKVGREALRRKEIVRATAIVADQFPGHFNHRRYWTTFLGQRTAFFHGIAQLAVLTQSPAFFAAISKKSRGYYEVTLIPIAEVPRDEKSSLQIIDKYVEATEANIHRQPAGWLWSHNRWKETDD